MVHLIKLLILFICLKAVFLPTHLAMASLQSGTQIWNLNIARFVLDKKSRWELYLEAQPRFDPNLPTRGRVLIRPGIWFNIDPQQNLMLGVLDLTDIEFNFKEFRIWQQYQRTDLVQGLTFLNRTRLEQRFIQSSSETGLRLRHMLRAQRPIQQGSPWSWVLFDELFVGINRNASQPIPGFDQNRAFIGFRHDFEGGRFSTEFGYMNQLLRGSQFHIPFLFLNYKQ